MIHFIFHDKGADVGMDRALFGEEGHLSDRRIDKARKGLPAKWRARKICVLESEGRGRMGTVLNEDQIDKKNFKAQKKRLSSSKDS